MSIEGYKRVDLESLGGPIEIEVSGKKILVQKPKKDSDEWVSVVSESVEFDRQEFMLDAWRRDYGKQFPIKDFNQLVRATGTNKTFREWYARCSLLYSDYTQMPLFLKGMISPTEYKNKAELLKEINKVNSEGSLELQALSREYDEKRKRIESSVESRLKSLVSKDKIVRILTINATYLPMSIILLIDNFSPKENPHVMKSLFAREMLLEYQKSLIKLVQDDPDVDIERIIEEGTTK